MKLRPYQEQAIADLRAEYARGRSKPVLLLPTGGGKTVIAAAIIRAAVAKGQRVLFLAHRGELLNQTVRKLRAAGVHEVRLIRAAVDQGSPTDPVVVASVQTMTTARWLAKPPAADLVICDECHHFVAKTFNRILALYPNARWLGLTATPERGDSAPLGDVFDALVTGATVRELVDLGNLVPCRVWAPSSVLKTGQLTISPSDAYCRHAEGQRAVVFCTTIEHANAVAEEMELSGIPTACVEGKHTQAQREDIFARLDRGELRAITSVHLLTEGWDLPSVSVCILARKPKSTGLFLQMVGRVLRPCEGKTQALLIDLCGSVHLHGPPDLDRTYSLNGKAISKADRESIRQCPTCGGVFLADQIVEGNCPHCGAAMPRKDLALPRSIDGELVDISSLPKLPPRVVTRSITAKFASLCPQCHRYIAVGDQVFWARGQKARHVECPAQRGAA